MTLSKSKVRKPRGRSTSSVYIPVHQDELMLAFARGFLELKADVVPSERVTWAQVSSARVGRSWGEVLLVELIARPEKRSERLSGSCVFFEDIAEAWAMSEDVVDDLLARIETFGDTVPGLVGISADASLFPSSELAIHSDMDLLVTARDHHEASSSAQILDRLAGAYALVRMRYATSESLVADFSSVLLWGSESGACAGKGLSAFASHIYRAALGSDCCTEDLRIFVAAAEQASSLASAQGLDAVSFVEKISLDCDALPLGVAPLLNFLKKVLNNEIEILDSMVDDTGGIGQRALLIFLLAPSPEKLNRWLAAREVGFGVGVLASVLSGLYFGIGGLSRDIKGTARDGIVGLVTAARVAIENKACEILAERHWKGDGTFTQLVRVGDHVVMSANGADAEVRLTIEVFAGIDIPVLVDQAGEMSIELIENGLRSTVRYSESSLVDGIGRVIQLLVRGRLAKKGPLTREFMERLLDGSMHPVIASTGATKGVVALKLEISESGSLRAGISQLAAAASGLHLLPP